MVTVSKSGISVAEFAASHLYLASLSVTLTRMLISAVTDLSVVLIVECIYKQSKNKFWRDQKKRGFTFLSFLYQVRVASGLPPLEVQEIF